MPKEAQPVLSVIVRRFRLEFEREVEEAIRKIDQAASRQPGFVGLQNSLSHEEDNCEMVTVFAFDSRANLEAWKNSPIRQQFVQDLDNHSQDSTTHTQFGDLALLLHPTARITKAETVVVLIFWILALGAVLRYLADFILPETLTASWRNVLLITVNVALISYVFLPWSSMLLTRLKVRISRKVGAR